MSDQPQVYRWHQINLKAMMFLIVLFSLPFAIRNFKTTRLQQFDQAAAPFESTDACLPHLKRLTSLRSLCVDGTGLSENSIVQLKLAVPDCYVWNGNSEPDQQQ